MSSAEWLGVTTLAVAGMAFLVASLALLNQLASLKRPLPSVDLFSVERIAEVPPVGGAVMQETLVAALIIRVTNRGHEPMINPRVYDYTPGFVVLDTSSVAYSMPYEMNRGQTVEMVTSYSLANDHDRVISVVWEEAALFRRTAKTMGVRFHESAQKDFAWDVTPSEQWKRIGPFGKKGWQCMGRPWSKWRPIWGTSTDPGDGNVWMNTHDYTDLGLFEEKRVLTQSFTFGEHIGQDAVIPDHVHRLRMRGEQLPKDRPQRNS